MMDRKPKLYYTGVRVVPGKMHGDVINWILHLQRYIFSLRYCVNKKILDVACGSGYGVSLISTVAKYVEGIDNNQNTIKWAKLNNYFYSKINFKILDIDKDKIESNYDCVVSFETIEHLKNPEFFIKNIKNVLNKYGYLIFSVPINEPQNRFHRKNYDWASVENLINDFFGLRVEWYSQTLHGIFRGKKRNALFAIGVAYNNLPPIFKRIENNFYRIARFIKKKIAENLKLIPKSRW